MVAVCMLFATTIFAQGITVKGTVTDASGEPVIGATVKQQGSTNGVVTNVDGNYSIDVPSAAKLEISYVGFKTQVVPVRGRASVPVKMQEESTAIDEVVVTALGIKRQARSLGYSTTKDRKSTRLNSSH